MTYTPARVNIAVDGSRRAVCAACGYVAAGRHPQRWHDCPAAPRKICGPGCQLKRTIEWWGIRDDGQCGCTEYAAQMDAWGPDGCIRRIEEIVQHLREAAAKRGLPFLATAARIAIGRAIEAARQEMSHGQEAVSKAREENVGRSE